MWEEAQGNLESVLLNPVRSYTSESVNQAVAVLIQLRDKLNDGSKEVGVLFSSFVIILLLRYRHDCSSGISLISGENIFQNP